MHKFLTGLVLIGSLTAVTVSCRSTKKIRKVIATPSAHVDSVGSAPVVAPVRDAHADSLAMIEQTIDQLRKNHIDFQTFSARMKVHYEGGDGKDNELNAFVRIKKDSLIWMSVNANVGPVNIEVFRVLITPDSVKILDKLKKIARLRSVSYLREEVHLPVDFKTLQDLLVGNPIFLDTSHVLFYRKEVKGISLFATGEFFRHYLTLNLDNTLQHSKLDDTNPMRSRTADMTYGEYDFSGPIPFSTYRKVSVAEKSKVDIEMSIKQYKFNEVLNVSFSIPKNYKRK
jgi:hypothetical protein